MPGPTPTEVDLGATDEAVVSRWRFNAREFPYWLVIILVIIGWMVWMMWTQESYNTAYHRIQPGLWTTVRATLTGFAMSLVLGLIAGLGRISENPVARNVALTYIEFVRGVPILVLIAMIAFVFVPQAASALGFDNSSVDFFWRGSIALALIYGAYLAEVFRAGIESVPRGQTEAGRSLGMSKAQTMRKIVLPQAVRNMTPAIGNDLIAMLKDSSLLSVLAVGELTYKTKLYTSSTFKYEEGYLVLTFFYLTMTLVLSLLLRAYRRYLGLAGD